MIHPTIFGGDPQVCAAATTLGEEREVLGDHIGCTNIAYAHQVHSDTVLYVEQPGEQRDADALFTDQKDLLCLVRVADCVPVCLYSHDEMKPIIAAIHSGRKGTHKNIVARTWEAIKAKFPQLRTETSFARIGPSICASCYEFGPEVEEYFPLRHIQQKSGKYYLNVAAQVYEQLVALGIPPQHIERSDICTHESELCPSRRQTKTTERMLVGIALRHLDGSPAASDGAGSSVMERSLYQTNE